MTSPPDVDGYAERAKEAVTRAEELPDYWARVEAFTAELRSVAEEAARVELKSMLEIVDHAVEVAEYDQEQGFSWGSGSLKMAREFQSTLRARSRGTRTT